MTAAHRAATVALLALLAGGPALAALPADAGTVRVAGVALLWWYGLAVAPLLGLAVWIVTVVRGRAVVAGDPRALALWISPAMLIGLGVQAFAGGASAPVLASTAMVAPLLAALVLGGQPASGRADAVVGAVAAGAVFWANFLIARDVSLVLGGRGWDGVALAALAAVVIAARPLRGWWRLPAVAAGVGAPTVAVIVTGLAVGSTPWAAWSAVASRPATTFGVASPWSTEGRAAIEPTVVALPESQEVTVMTAGTLRVIEREGERAVVRDWTVAPGDRLALHAGDRVVLPPGLRVRFDPDSRVPGVPLTGVAWVDPRDPHDAVRALAAAVTFTGGALALLGPVAVRAGPAMMAIVLVTLAAVAACGWGVYAALAGADLALGAPSVAALVGVLARVVPAHWLTVLLVAGGAGLVLLGAAALAAVRDRVAGSLPWSRSRVAALTCGVLVAGAAAAAVAPVDAWQALSLGLGLAATVAAAPRLAGGHVVGRVAGAILGGALFVVLAAAGVTGGDGTLAEYPALAAAPVAWAVAWVAGARRG